MRVRVVLAMVAALSVGAVGDLALNSAASAAGQPATQRVIVLLRNQDQNQPATPALLSKRRASFQDAQAPVMSQLSATGARNVKSYSLLDAVSATVSANEEQSLQSNPAVSKVIPDQLIHVGSPTRSAGATASGAGVNPPAGTCSANGKVELDPQALETIGADSQQPGAKTARSLGITGAGVKVAFIADGLDINDPDFIRANGQHVFVDYKDFSGFGTSSTTGGGEAFLDASSIAAQGRKVYNVSHYSALGLNQPCDIRVEGVAPGASLVGLDVFGPTGDVYDSTFLQAINYAVTQDHVNVLNESLGSNYFPDDQGDLDVIKQANDAAVAAGTTVTVSSGDAGPTSTIGTPATDPQVIDAGASTTFRSYAETQFQGYDYPGVNGWLNDNISGLSSGGFQQDGQTVDLVAPGDLNWLLCSTDVAMYQDCYDFAGQPAPVEDTGGTSEAAPVTAGVAALVIQAYEKTHGDRAPSAAQVKQLIVSNTDDIGSPAEQQGSGRIDAYKAVVAAEGASAQGTGTVLDSPTQLNVSDQPGTAETLHDTITNPSNRAETLSLTGRALGAYSQVKAATVTLADSDPQLTDETGTSNNLQTVKFTVPANENRLSVSLAFQGGPTAQFYTVPQLTLIDPDGRYAAYDIPQGNANFGNSQVTDPTPGTWTALVYAPDSSDGGFTGPVQFSAGVARYTSFGTVSPSSVHLSPGQSTGVALQVSTPSTPGDAAGAIVIDTENGDRNGSDDANNQAGPSSVTTIPVTLRSLIPAGNSSFTDQTTGGNGRAFLNGQTFYYQLDVPFGSPELNATVTLGNNPNYPFQAWLVDPNGIAEAYASNEYQQNAFASSPGPINSLIGAQLHALSPAGGRWTVIVEFGPTAGGTQLSEPFTVVTNQIAITADPDGLPNNAATQLTRGQSDTYGVRVTNTGTAPEALFSDARLSGTTQVKLGALDGRPGVTVPLGTTATLPIYLVPTDSTSLQAQASTTGSTPIEFDTSPAAIGDGELGDPDIGSTAGTTATASLSADPLSQGAWDIAPNVVGPFGATGVSRETVSTGMSVVTSRFDTTVSSPTGDLEADSANPTAATLQAFSPTIAAPGQTVTIPVTITPTAAAGTTVSGTLYVDDYNDDVFDEFVDPVGDQVVAIPYSYTVK